MSHPTAVAALPQTAALSTESLCPSEWANLLGLTPRAVQKWIASTGAPTETKEVAGGLANAIAFCNLKEEWRLKLERIRTDRYCRTFGDLLTVGQEQEPELPYTKQTANSRARAQAMHETMTIFYAALDANCSVEVAYERAMQTWTREARTLNPELLRGNARPLKLTIGWRTIQTERVKIDALGGIHRVNIAFLGHGKQVPHMAARNVVPEELIAHLKAGANNAGTWSAAVRAAKIKWGQGEEVPGLGRAQSPDEPFPIGDSALDKYKPSKAARTRASKGAFKAKAMGLLPAPPMGREGLQIRQRIVFDDKRPDQGVLDDHTGDPIELMLYLAMDESNGEIVGYLLREKGGVRQTDVEGLTAFVLRVAGFAGKSAGYATTLKYERGTVAISPERKKLLHRMFPGEIIVSQTDMIAGKSGPGAYAEEGSGNFMGKAKIEAFMKTFDEYMRHVPGQMGNVYQNRPLALGDLLLTPAALASKQYKPKHTMVEEAVLCGQTARTLAWVKSPDAEVPGAYEAAQATGVKPNLLFKSQYESHLQAFIAHYNAERGHRRTGYNTLGIVQKDGSLRYIAESNNDKAARQQADLAAQGRTLQRISAADAVVLLHKVKRVTVKPSGAKVRVNGVERTYWAGDSLAVAAAQQSSLGEATYLALFNPEDPRELLLLQNSPNDVPRTADELPEGHVPRFFEVLPLFENPDSESSRLARAEAVQRNHSRVNFEVVRDAAPFIAERTAEREHNADLAEPLRASVTVLRNQSAVERPSTALADDLSDGTTAEPDTRRQAKPAAQARLENFLAQHSDSPSSDSAEPEII